MPKGEGKKAQRQIDVQGNIAQNSMNALQRQLYPQQSTMFSNYLYGTGQNLGDYSNLMRNYQNLYGSLSGVTGLGGGYQAPGGGYQSPFTGGYGFPREPMRELENPLGRGPAGGPWLTNPVIRGENGQPNIRWGMGSGGGQIRGDTSQGMTQPIQGGNYQEQFNQLFPGSTISLNELMANKDKLESMGMRVVPNAAGNSADIQLPDGTFIDIGAGMSRSGGGPVPKQWNPDAPGGGFGPQSIFGNIDPYNNALLSALGGYGDFARTGGFTPQNIQDIRERSVAPIRSIYSSGRREIDRSRRLGGAAVSAPAAEARLGRETAYATGDIAQRGEADLAGLVQSGRLAGLGGLSQTGLAGAGLQSQIAQALLGAQLGSLGGMTSLYGTTPALASTFGNQVLGSQGNLLNAQQLQNQLGLGLIQGQLGKAQIPGDFSQAMGNIGSVLGLGGQALGGIGGAKGNPGSTNTGYGGINPGSFGRGVSF